MTTARTLADWLAWQETQHPRRIDLGLERVAAVWARMEPPPTPPVITVGGTNGKGSCVRYLEAWYDAAGYRVGAYSSPHLLRYNERVRIGAREVEDAALCAAFERIDRARAAISLSYFEFATLAALDLFARADLDIAILEVGLGGRLDAVNIIPPDVALVTNIGRDHMQWLGHEPNQIAFEKAGIFRPGRPAVIGQREPPPRLRERAGELGAIALQLGQEFDWTADGEGWCWRGPAGSQRAGLPPPALRGAFQFDNAAAALCAAHCLHERRPLSAAAVRQGLLRARLDGRFQVRPGALIWIFDVAHNPDATLVLAANLRAFGGGGQRHAICGVLGDKDVAGLVAPLVDLIDHWHLAPPSSDRALPADHLAAAIVAACPRAAPRQYASVEAACAAAARQARTGDLILVTGSFVTVEAALRNPASGSV